jgi:hypothetical protein
VARSLTNLRTRSFSLFYRLTRFVIRDERKETASLPRSLLVSGFALADYALLSLPGLRRFGAVHVFVGGPRLA